MHIKHASDLAIRPKYEQLVVSVVLHVFHNLMLLPFLKVYRMYVSTRNLPNTS